MGTVGDIDVHIDPQACRLGTCDDYLRGVAEVGELHQLFHAVVGGEGRVEQHIGEVGGAEHIKPASHGHLVEWSLQTCKEVHVGLAPGDALGFLAGIDELQVTGPHLQVHHDLVQIAEVHLSHHVERLVVVGIQTVVLDEQLGIDDTDRVVVHTHPDAVGLTHEVGIFHVDLTIDIAVLGRAPDGELALAVAFKTDDLVGHKAID